MEILRRSLRALNSQNFKGKSYEAKFEFSEGGRGGGVIPKNLQPNIPASCGYGSIFSEATSSVSYIILTLRKETMVSTRDSKAVSLEKIM